MRDGDAPTIPEPVGGTPAETAAFFRREVQRHAEVIRAANIRAE